MKRRSKTAGDVWRVQGDDKAADTSELGPFDEIVVGRRPGEVWLHVEMLSNNSAFVHLGERCFWIHLPSKKKPRITWEETRPWVPFKGKRG
jgi:hypothetical protein